MRRMRRTELYVEHIDHHELLEHFGTKRHTGIERTSRLNVPTLFHRPFGPRNRVGTFWRSMKKKLLVTSGFLLLLASLLLRSKALVTRSDALCS